MPVHIYFSRFQSTHSTIQPFTSGLAPLAPLPRGSGLMEMGRMGAARESDITAKAIARLKRRMRRVFSLVR